MAHTSSPRTFIETVPATSGDPGYPIVHVIAPLQSARAASLNHHLQERRLRYTMVAALTVLLAVLPIALAFSDTAPIVAWTSHRSSLSSSSGFDSC